MLRRKRAQTTAPAREAATAGIPLATPGVGPASRPATAPPASPIDNVRPIGGIDLGGTKIEAAVLNPSHKVLTKARRPTPDSGGPEDVADAMAEAMNEAAEAAGLSSDSLKAIGVGSPGSVDVAAGTVSGAGNLPGWSGSYPLADSLRQRLGTEVKLGNDVTVGTNAEYKLGAGKPYRSILGVFWGTGVGGGIILDGREWHGRGAAGEIGHMVVKRGGASEPGGGLQGTIEAYAGRKSLEARARREHDKGRDTILFKLAKKHDKPHLTSSVWGRALEHGDPLAEELLYKAVRSLAAGIASAVNLLDVEAVIIGGGLGVRFADTLVPKIEKRMHKHLFRPDDPPAVHTAALGDDGGVIGASLLVAV